MKCWKALEGSGMDSLPGAGAREFLPTIIRLINKGKCGRRNGWILCIKHTNSILPPAHHDVRACGNIAGTFWAPGKDAEVQSRKPENAKGFPGIYSMDLQDVDTLLAKYAACITLPRPEEYIPHDCVEPYHAANVKTYRPAGLTWVNRWRKYLLHGGQWFWQHHDWRERGKRSRCPHRFTSTTIQQSIGEAGFEPQLRDQQYRYGGDAGIDCWTGDQLIKLYRQKCKTNNWKKRWTVSGSLRLQKAYPFNITGHCDARSNIHWFSAGRKKVFGWAHGVLFVAVYLHGFWSFQQF